MDDDIKTFISSELKSTHEKMFNETEKLKKVVVALQDNHSKQSKSIENIGGELKTQEKNIADALVEKQEEIQKLDKQIATQQKKLEEFEEFLASNEGMLFSKNGQPTDHPDSIQKMDEFLRKGRSQEQIEIVKGLRQGSNPEGGYLVRPVLLDGIIQKLTETSPVRPFARVISGDQPTELLTDLARVESSFVGELENPTESQDAISLGEIKLDPKEQKAVVYLTEKNLETASFDLESYILGKVQQDFSDMENKKFVLGDHPKCPKGILSANYNFVGSDNYTHTNGDIETVKSGSATSIVLEGLINLMTVLHPRFEPNARLFMHKAAYYHTIQFNSDTNYHLLETKRMLFGDPNTDVPPMMRVQFWHDMARPDASNEFAAGEKVAILADLSEGYIIQDALSMTILKDPFTSNPQVKMIYRKRVDGCVANFDAIKVMEIGV